MTKPPTTKAEPRKATTQELADRLRAAIFKLSNHPKSDMAALLPAVHGLPRAVDGEVWHREIPSHLSAARRSTT
jgi:hypothetical protein